MSNTHSLTQKTSEIPILEVFTDYVCPWCYLGDNRLKKIKQTYTIFTRLVHFPLHPDTPTEGRDLKDLFRCGPEQIDAKNVHMQSLMEAEGLLFRHRTHTYNSRLAQEIGTWAETRGGESIHDKFFEAYFVDGRNLADKDVILAVVTSVGLDPDDARSVIEERRFKKDVDEDWGKSYQYGITGVPTFVIAGKRLVGAQSYEALAELVEEAGAKKR